MTLTPFASKCLIIAEAGVNHNGSLEIAKKLVDVAWEAGADAVKFQTFKAENIATKSAAKAAYQKETTDGKESQFEMLKKLELDEAAHKVLISHCKSKGILFLSTPFDLESVDLLHRMGLELFKIPSGEITNFPLLRKVGSLGKEIVLSTGMAETCEIEAALAVLEKAGTPRNRITVLHCTTEYPAPLDEINLRAMLSIRDLLKVNVGYSDHTEGIEVAVAAAALGATIIEKHFTLDRNMPGPDHKASLEPHELKEMVRQIRNVERSLGDGVKKPSPSELKNKEIARKSIVAATDIRKGDLFSERNLTVKRPGTGLNPMQWEEVMGKQAKRDFLVDELIELED